MKTKEEKVDNYIAMQYIDYGDLSYQAEEQMRESYLAGYEEAEELFKPKWISVSEQMPPSSTELLVKSPDGLIHLANWRESYNIFTCQNKDESSYDWKYMEIPQ